MPRIQCLRALQTAYQGVVPASSALRVQVAAFSTSTPARDLRTKLWKGEAPGPEDPYTQRPDNVESKVPQESSPDIPHTGPRRHASGILLPPTTTEALPEKSVENTDPTYTPATRFEELEVAPSLKNWWNLPGHWGEESQFKGFAKVGKVVDKDVLEVYLRRAVVEVLALEKSEKLAKWSTKKWAVGGIEDAKLALSVPIKVAEDGKASLDSKMSNIIVNLTAVEKNAPLEKLSDEEAATLRNWDSSWQNMVLNDEMKFALRKRMYQLTGNFIPDAKFGAARTVKHFLTMTAKQPKPKKLAKTLETRADIATLPNVKIHHDRVTMIDKEKAVGRWKVITEELKKRGLPVTGTGNLPGNSESKWMSQKA